MCLESLILVGLSLSPYEFFHSLVFDRKKKRLLDEYLSDGDDIEGIIHSRRRLERRYGLFTETHTAIQYSYSLLNKTYKRKVTLSCQLPGATTTIALKVLPEKYPESACQILFLKRQQQNSSNRCPIACRIFLAFVGVTVGALFVLVLIIEVSPGTTDTMWYLLASYVLVLILFTSLGYPCALVEYRCWKRSILVDEHHASHAEYQLVARANNKNIKTAATKCAIVQEVTHHSLSLEDDGSNDDEQDASPMEANEGILIPTMIFWPSFESVETC